MARKLLFVPLVLAFLAFHQAEGSPPCYTSASYSHQATAVSYEPVYALYQPAALVTIPQYSVSYAGPQQVQQVQQAPDNNKALLDAVEKLTAKVDALEKGHLVQPQVLPQQVQPPPKEKVSLGPVPLGDHVQIFQARCASCHDSKVSTKLGGGLALFEGGKLLPWTDKVYLGVALDVITGKMPKSGKMPPEEKAKILAFLDESR